MTTAACGRAAVVMVKRYRDDAMLEAGPHSLGADFPLVAEHSRLRGVDYVRRAGAWSARPGLVGAAPIFFQRRHVAHSRREKFSTMAFPPVMRWARYVA